MTCFLSPSVCSYSHAPSDAVSWAAWVPATPERAGGRLLGTRSATAHALCQTRSTHTSPHVAAATRGSGDSVSALTPPTSHTAPAPAAAPRSRGPWPPAGGEAPPTSKRGNRPGAAGCLPGDGPLPLAPPPAKSQAPVAASDLTCVGLSWETRQIRSSQGEGKAQVKPMKRQARTPTGPRSPGAGPAEGAGALRGVRRGALTLPATARRAGGHQERVNQGLSGRCAAASRHLNHSDSLFRALGFWLEKLI